MKFKSTFLVFIVLILAAVGRLAALDKEVYFTPSGKKVDVVKGAILVKFKSNVPGRVKQAVFKETGSRKTGSIRKLGVDKIEVPKGITISEIVELYSKRSDVVYAEPIYIRHAMKLPDEYFTVEELKQRQWGLEKIKAPDGWDIETGSAVVVAVIDTGIDLDHPDLDSNIWDNPDKLVSYTLTDTTDNYTVKYDTHGWDFINNDNDPSDDNDHGTHVAGIIGAEMNSSTYGVVGVSWNNKLMAVKVLASDSFGTTENIIKGIIYAADRGADVINMSLGGGPESQAERDAVNYAYNKGCLLVAATGNNGKAEISYPAAYENVIAVGATDPDDQKADFSNYGDGLDMVAPGVVIYSTIIDGYGNSGGTSMASPYVSGLASLIISYWNKGTNTSWTPLQVRNAITSNCDDINASSFSGWDNLTGYGRVNIEKTLKFIQQGVVNISEKEVLVYPNPFNPDNESALIVLSQDADGIARKLRIYSLDGQLVKETGASGTIAAWDGRNKEGNICASGLYFFYLDTTAGSERGKITLIR